MRVIFTNSVVAIVEAHNKIRKNIRGTHSHDIILKNEKR